MKYTRISIFSWSEPERAGNQRKGRNCAPSKVDSMKKLETKSYFQQDARVVNLGKELELCSIQGGLCRRRW